MFEDYLIGKVACNAIEVHFIRLFEAEMARCGAKKEAFGYPHYNNYCADGTHLMEADPIFSAKSLVAGDVLRISVYEEIAEYTVMHNTRGDDDELDELFLAIKITDTERARQDMSGWIRLQVLSGG